MKSIGILTFWNVPNYGTFLQAYALQKAISSIDKNYSIKQIAYLNPKHYRQYYALNNINYRGGLINPMTYCNITKRLFSNKIRELRLFLEYYKKFIPCTERLTESTISEIVFDSVVLGSDIIWDYSIEFFGNDKYLFGNGLNAKHVISYAASFGTVKNTMCPEYVKQGLNRISSISVRDENSRMLVKKYVNKDAQIVCDPTLLWDFKKDVNIPDIGCQNYIVVYGSNFTPELIKGCIDYAKINNLQIICLDSLDDTFTWCDKNIKQNKLNPFQWLSYFKYAHCIFTCTHHGLMFGLIFNKRIVFSPTQFIMDKASSLIDFLDLKSVLVDYDSFEQKVKWDWDYSKINTKINEMKEISWQFLQDNL